MVLALFCVCVCVWIMWIYACLYIIQYLNGSIHILFRGSTSNISKPKYKTKLNVQQLFTFQPLPFERTSTICRQFDHITSHHITRFTLLFLSCSLLLRVCVHSNVHVRRCVRVCVSSRLSRSMRNVGR